MTDRPVKAATPPTAGIEPPLNVTPVGALLRLRVTLLVDVGPLVTTLFHWSRSSTAAENRAPAATLAGGSALLRHTRLVAAPGVIVSVGLPGDALREVSVPDTDVLVVKTLFAVLVDAVAPAYTMRNPVPARQLNPVVVTVHGPTPVPLVSTGVCNVGVVAHVVPVLPNPLLRVS